MTSLRLLKVDSLDVHLLKPLFREYSYKNFQQKAQGLDVERMPAFFAGGTKSSFADADTSIWVVKDGDEIQALASLSPNAWHSRFYGYRMGRCNTFLSYKSPDTTTPMLCEALLNEGRERNFEMVSVRIDGNEFQNLHLLESQGFHLIDVSVKMAGKIRTAQRLIPHGVRIRPYENADREAVIRISGDSHGFNHFFNDSRLDAEATRNLFRAWVERCVDSLAAYVFVAEDESGVIGFVTYLVNRRFNESFQTRLLVLDYIVLDARCQGRGIGPVLQEHSLDALREQYDQVELRTSSNNYPALSLYTRYGMRIISTDFLLHWWRK